MLDKLKNWQKAAAECNNLLANAFFQQVINAYEKNFSYQLTTGTHNIRCELDKWCTCEDWQAFFKVTYDPHHPIRNLSEISTW